MGELYLDAVYCLGKEGKKMTPSSIEEKAGSGGNSLVYISSLELPLF